MSQHSSKNIIPFDEINDYYKNEDEKFIKLVNLSKLYYKFNIEQRIYYNSIRPILIWYKKAV